MSLLRGELMKDRFARCPGHLIAGPDPGRPEPGPTRQEDFLEKLLAFERHVLSLEARQVVEKRRERIGPWRRGNPPIALTPDAPPGWHGPQATRVWASAAADERLAHDAQYLRKSRKLA